MPENLQKCNHHHPELCRMLGKHILGGLLDRWNDSRKYRVAWCKRAGVDLDEMEEMFPPTSPDESIPRKRTKKQTKNRKNRITHKSSPAKRGVGTELKAILKENGINASSGCSCRSRANEMDANGLEWCEQNRDTIIDWLMEGASERLWMKPYLLLFPGDARRRAGELLDRAILRVRGVPVVEWQEPVTKNLIYHVWPVPGRWKHHLDRVIGSIDQFNGKRILGIVTDGGTDSAETVKEYVSGHGFEFIERKNKQRLREVVTFLPMLELMESLDPNEVTFSGHAKGSRHENTGDGSTIGLWADAMYRTVYDVVKIKGFSVSAIAS